LTISQLSSARSFILDQPQSGNRSLAHGAAMPPDVRKAFGFSEAHYLFERLCL
jgi:hypothetical protein